MRGIQYHILPLFGIVISSILSMGIIWLVSLPVPTLPVATLSAQSGISLPTLSRWSPDYPNHLTPQPPSGDCKAGTKKSSSKHKQPYKSQHSTDQSPVSLIVSHSPSNYTHSQPANITYYSTGQMAHSSPALVLTPIICPYSYIPNTCSRSHHLRK